MADPEAEESGGTRVGNYENALREGEREKKVEEASDESKQRKREDEGDLGLIEGKQRNGGKGRRACENR